ncbi:MAG: hypothetical protein DRI77_00230 [Chloroflexi bacterium]|nr:MAG: hypothetical protein B6I35_13855 [Anaerolineaceae bacterium 4572_32.2]RLD00520.1 MAG: hypothetical protein DRI77_00230 [Chloroflexota bacterium]
MTIGKIIERKELAQTLDDWLVASDIPPTMPLELFFLPGEVVIRPQPSEQQELLEWFKGFRQRYDDVLRRLAGTEVGT